MLKKNGRISFYRGEEKREKSREKREMRKGQGEKSKGECYEQLAMSNKKRAKGKKEDLSKSDGIQISDRPTWEHTAKELWAILGKRLISLPSKMLGFKPFCLYLASWLLVQGYIRDWIWFCIVVIVLFGIVGLKVLANWKIGGRDL